MNLEEAFQRLTPGSKSKRLQQLWPAIEQKLVEGVSHAQILGALNDNGFELTERTYKSYLYRYRKRRRTADPRPASAHPTEHTQLSSPDAGPADVRCALAPEGRQRPASFEFDPRGISPDLLK